MEILHKKLGASQATHRRACVLKETVISIKTGTSKRACSS